MPDWEVMDIITELTIMGLHIRRGVKVNIWIGKDLEGFARVC